MSHTLVVTVLVLATSSAAARPGELDRFRPALDARGYLTVNASAVLDPGDVSFGLGSLQWGRHLLAADDDLVAATLVGTVGVHALGVPLELGASLPFTIMKAAGFDTQEVGELGLHAKVRIARAGRLGLAAAASVDVPTITPQLSAIVDGGLGRLRVAVNAGVRLGKTSTLAMDGMAPITTSTTLPFGAAAAWSVAPDKVELVAEVFGSIPLGASARYQPLEALGGVKVYLAKNSYLALGAGRGLVPDRVGNPDFRAVIGIVFEPRPAQRIAASVPDLVAIEAPPASDDRASDRDNDGIFDRDDACPDEPERYDGVDDEDGCPEAVRELVIETDAEIITLQPIEFEFDKATLRPSAHPILRAVAAALNDNPEVTLVEVQGHTDERGDDAYNLDLSNRRAATVMAFLRDQGVAAERLTSKGYGETQPVDPRRTEAAYQLNRRVAFVIEERR